MYRYLTRKNPYIGLFLIVSPLRALCAVALAAALGAAIDYASAGELGGIWKYVLSFALYILLDLAVDALDQYSRSQTLRRAMTSLKRDLMSGLTHMDLPRFREHGVPDYISALTADTELLRESYFRTILGMYADFLCCAAALGALLWMSPILGAFVLAVSLAQSLVPMVFSKKLERTGERYSAAQERRMRSLRGTLSAFLTAKVFHIEDRLGERHHWEEDRAEDAFRRMSFTREWANSVSYVFNQVSLLGVFLLGAVLNIKGVISLAQVVAASQLISYVSDPVLWLNGDIADLRSVRAPVKKLAAILSSPGEKAGGAVKAGGALTVRGLTFSYGGNRVLDGVTYDFKPGGKYLICGPSGGGKSTLLTILAGLRDDYGGTVALNGADIRTLSRKCVAENVCLLDQEPYLFDDTLLNNVCLFDERPDRDRVTDALRRAELGELVKALPQGPDTPLGDGADRLSGGEKQRVAIARAIYRGTPVLLLDESTSHLDPATAAGIERTVFSLPGVTVILVSHNATETARQLAGETLELRDGTLSPQTAAQKVAKQG